MKTGLSVIKLPIQLKRIIFLLMSLFFLIISYFFCLRSPLNEIEQLELIEQDKHQLLALKKRSLNQLISEVNEYEAYESSFVQQKRWLTSMSERANVIALINHAVSENNLLLQKLTWQREQQKGEFNLLPFDIELVGSYNHFGLFSEDIARLPKLVIFYHSSWQVYSNKEQQLLFKAQGYLYQLKEKE